jgi:hypothetical protein
MSVTSPEAIVEAVMADLIAYCADNDFSPQSTRPYAEPTIVLPDQCPLLAVWCELTTYQIAATGPPFPYDRHHTVFVGWYVWNPKEAEVGGVGDPGTVMALSNTLEQLIAQLDTYSAGIPTIGQQLVSTLQSRSVKPQEGALWRGLAELEVKETT